jgi:hypothetical protein
MTPASAPSTPPDAVIFQLLFNKVAFFGLGSLARIGVADHMSDAPMPVEQIAAASGTHAPSLYRVLRMLAGFGVFTESPGKQFALTPVGSLLRSGVPGSMRDMAIMQVDNWSVESFKHMDHSIRTGGDGVTVAFGKSAFDLFRDIPEEAENFHRAMTNFTAILIEAVLPVADFSGFKRMADVGGGHGVMMREILKALPNLQGVVFDLPEVVSGAPAAERLSLEGGSFFEKVPGGCDAYIMKSIVHDWDDESCRRILSLMRDELAKTAPENGRVFLVEMVVDDGPEPTPAKLLDMEMLVLTRGGKERTETEFAELFASAGLKLVSIKRTQSPICLIEAKLA